MCSSCSEDKVRILSLDHMVVANQSCVRLLPAYLSPPPTSPFIPAQLSAPRNFNSFPLVTLGTYGSLFQDHSFPSPNKVFSSSIFNLNFTSSVKPSVIPQIMEIPIIHSLRTPSFSPYTLIRIVT